MQKPRLPGMADGAAVLLCSAEQDVSGLLSRLDFSSFESRCVSLVVCLLALQRTSRLGMQQESPGARFGSHVALGKCWMFLLEQGCVEGLAIPTLPPAD